MAVAFLRNPDEAQDAVQEACLKAWTNLSQLRGESIRPWFLTIVANQCRRRPAHDVVVGDQGSLWDGTVLVLIQANGALSAAVERFHTAG